MSMLGDMVWKNVHGACSTCPRAKKSVSTLLRLLAQIRRRDGQSHAHGVVAGQNVAEVAGGHHEVHALAHADGAALDQLEYRR